MIFYTTKEQEELLDIDYEKKLKIKKRQLNELKKLSNKPQKYSAYAYVKREPRTFYVDANSNSYVQINDENHECFSIINFSKMSDEEVTRFELDGCIYKTDKDFDSQLKEFVSRHGSYFVTFYPAKKSGFMGYCTGNSYEIPAEIYSEKVNLEQKPEEIIELVDDDKYDIGCM